MRNRVLVIGGAGFMGSHTADELSTRGYQVTILDVQPSPWVREDQQMVVADIKDESALLAAMGDVDTIYHFAGIADIEDAKSNPYMTIEANVMGVVKVLECANKQKIKRFVYASTMYVYSNFGSFYRASKQAAEVLIEAYASEYKIDFTMLRYGSLYGPRAQRWNGIRKFVTSILQDGEFKYSGDGSEMREYIHVKDAARLSVDVIDDNHINTAITITGQQIFRVDQLASILFEISGLQPNMRFDGIGKNSDHYGKTPYRYNPRTAKKLVPTEFVDLGQGLLEVIDEVHRELKVD